MAAATAIGRTHSRHSLASQLGFASGAAEGAWAGIIGRQANPGGRAGSSRTCRAGGHGVFTFLEGVKFGGK